MRNRRCRRRARRRTAARRRSESAGISRLRLGRFRGARPRHAGTSAHPRQGARTRSTASRQRNHRPHRHRAYALGHARPAERGATRIRTFPTAASRSCTTASSRTISSCATNSSALRLHASNPRPTPRSSRIWCITRYARRRKPLRRAVIAAGPRAAAAPMPCAVVGHPVRPEPHRRRASRLRPLVAGIGDGEHYLVRTCRR